MTSPTFITQIPDELNQATTEPVEVTTITLMRTGYHYSHNSDPSMTEFKKFKESMMIELKAVHSKFHSATSSTPEIDRLVARNREDSFHKKYYRCVHW